MIAEHIKKYIEANNIKQVDLAKQVGMSKQLLNNKLRGDCRISAEEYIDICDALGLNYEKFVLDERSALA